MSTPRTKEDAVVAEVTRGSVTKTVRVWRNGKSSAHGGASLWESSPSVAGYVYHLEEHINFVRPQH